MIRASTNETINVSITIIATSPKKFPTSPANSSKVEKAINVVIIADTIAGRTSIVPSTAAYSGDLPSS